MNEIMISSAMLQFNRVVREEFKVLSTSCTKGCSYCCYHPILVSPAEALYIKNRLRFAPQILDKIKPEWHIWHQKAQNLLKPLDAHNVLEFQRKYLEMGIKCPFLLDNLCSIYSFRPLICQTYFTQNSPDTCKAGETDANCTDFHLEKVRQLNDICKKFNFDNASFNLFPNVLADLMTTKP